MTVRRATPKDAAAFVQTMGDPEVLPNLLQVPHTSEEIWQQRLADNVTPGKADIVLVAEREGRVVGNAGLHPFPNLRRRHAAGLGIAVAREAQGQGVGHVLMQALCDFADNWAQLLRIELTVFADNERAIRLYRRFGFEHEGTHRGYALRAGRFVDVHCMARLHPQPPSIR
ncbi:MAG: GNAT family N-acetyltransferase [Rubrivivax sp.]